MANFKEQQPVGEVLATCRALVLKSDPQTNEWNNTGSISKVHLIKTQSVPPRKDFVYHIDGRLETTKQVTISVILEQNTEYSGIEGDPDCYRLTVSPQEVYVLRLTPDPDGKTFAYLVQQVLRILRALQTRTEELPLSPREAWIPEVAPLSPPQPNREQLLTSSNLGKRIPASNYPSRSNSSHYLIEQLNLPTSSTKRALSPSSPYLEHRAAPTLSTLSTTKGISSSSPYLNEHRETLNQPTLSTLNSPSSSSTSLNEQRSAPTLVPRRWDFEAQIDSLCNELSYVISDGDIASAVKIVNIMTSEKVPLSIKMKNPKVITVEYGDQSFNLKVVVEDRETSGGVFVMKVLPTTKIEKLKEEVAERYGFPPKVQKWIIGKKMAQPSSTLANFNISKEGYTAFLYLVSGKSVGLKKHEFEHYLRRNDEGSTSTLGPQMSTNDTIVSGAVTSPSGVNSQLSRTTSMPTLQSVGQPVVEGYASHFMVSEPSTRSLNRSNPLFPASSPINQGDDITKKDQMIHTASGIADIQTLLQAGEAVMNPMMERDVLNEGHSIPVEDTEVVPQGWKCNQCTYVNTPTRPGCEMCGGDRPDDYVVPENTMIRDQERVRLQEELRQQQLFEQEMQQDRNLALRNMLIGHEVPD